MSDKEEKTEETVWMRCRAKPDPQIDSLKTCKGNEALVVFKRRMSMDQGGGVMTRYRCTSCKGIWHHRM